MDVGTPEPMLLSLPETGGAAVSLALPLLLSGLALAGAGRALGRKR